MTTARRVTTPILAIELSQRTGGVAVVAPDGRAHSIEVAGGRRDRDDLAPAIAEALAAARLSATALETVAVDVGPGGFTGLRISIAMAQSIAEVVGAQVVAVPGALVAAASTPELATIQGEILVLSAAKGGTAWGTTLVRPGPGDGWRIEGTAGILEVPPSRSLVAVVADEHLGDAFRASIPSSVPVHEPRFDAASLARVALEAGPDLQVHVDPARLVPIYPREPEAVRVWRERHPDNHAESSSPRPR